MKTQPLSIDPTTLQDSRLAAEAAGMSWSAYVTKATRRQVIRDNLRRAAELKQQRTPEQAAEDDTWGRLARTRLAAAANNQ